MKQIVVGEVVQAVGGDTTRALDQSIQARGICTDSRELAPECVFFALRGPNFDGHSYVAEAVGKGAVAAVCATDWQPGPELDQLPVIRVPDTRQALGDLARHWRRKCAPTVIAITGSMGKTTVTAMVAHVLSRVAKCVKSPQSFNNDVGVPLSIFQLEPEHQYAVLELGTSNFGEIRYLTSVAEPDIGVLTNVSETHLANLHSVEGVARAKAELFETMRPDGTAVVNVDNPHCVSIMGQYPGRAISFGFSPKANIWARQVTHDNGTLAFALPGGPQFELRLPGEFNVGNALACIAVCSHLGVPLETIAKALSDFSLPPKRMSIETVRGVVWINDAYNSNPASARAALTELGRRESKHRKIAILGDMLELGSASAALHHQVGEFAASQNLDRLWAVGEQAAELANAAKDAGLAPSRVHHRARIEEAIAEIVPFLRPGDTVLLKGSRGMHMERVLEAFKERSDAAQTTAPSRSKKRPVSRLSDDARREMILRYLPLVSRVVYAAQSTMDGFLTMDDLRSAANLGLIHAIDNFDPNRGVKFETYACRRMLGAILDDQRLHDPLSRYMRGKLNKVNRAKDRLRLTHGRDASIVEIAEALEWPVEKLFKILRAAEISPVSIDTRVAADQEVSLLDRQAVIDWRYRVRAGRELVDLGELIQQLNRTERHVVMLRYVEDFSMKQIAEALGLSPSRVTQLHKGLLERLRRLARNAQATAQEN